MATYVQIKRRTAYLRGETDYTTSSANTVIDDHINATIQDAVNLYPYSFTLSTSTLTLSSGTANLPTDYNPKWHLKDARIVNSSQADDSIFTEIDPVDRDLYADSDYVYWITYNSSTQRYIFNTLTQTGSVAIYYYALPTNLSSDSDVCVIPDAEMVAYGAAGKMWVGDERNTELATMYENEYRQRAQALYHADQSFGPVESQGTIIRMNSRLRRV